MTVEENPEIGIHLMAGIAILILMALYVIGILSRSVVFPAEDGHSLKSHLAAGVSAGLITMGPYGKSAFAGLNFGSQGMLFDVMVIAGYAIVFGMMSRETLDKIIAGAGKKSGPAQPRPKPPHKP